MNAPSETLAVIPQIALGLGAGLLLGGGYFWGLWLTVSRVSGALHPARYLVRSFFFRLGLLLAAFYLLLMLGPVAALSAMAGFYVARHLWLRTKGAATLSTAVEAGRIQNGAPN